jgi:2-haloacid dehalogenase
MIDAAVFDVNETLFPLDPVRSRMVDAGLEAHRLEPWFRAVLVDGIAAAATGTLVTFADLARHHLDIEFDRAGLRVPADAGDGVLEGFNHTVAHPDVRPALEHLRAAGVRAVTFTNGSATITRSFLQRAGLDDLVDDVWDVQAAGRWKPATAAYRWAVDRLDVPADRVAMIAVHPWDIHGAMVAGLIGGFVDREHSGRYPPGFRAPDHRARTLTEVAAQLTT